MGWTKYQAILALTMTVMGSINTLTTKWTDRLEATGSDGQTRPFNHPFVQGWFMFFGESLCLATFLFIFQILRRRQDGSEHNNRLVKGNRDFNPTVLIFPAICDVIATTMSYVGLQLTYASSFQMLRGAVIVFVGVLSVIFLSRRFMVKQWLGIIFIISGLTIVGASDFLSSSNTYSPNIVLGDLLIVASQVMTAIQMVYEEKYVNTIDIPALQAVGWEGVFGVTLLTVLLLPMYFIHAPDPINNNAHKVIEDLPDALAQIMDNKMLIIAIGGTVFSIAFFNFAGLSVTKEISATTRMVIGSFRTMVVWSVSLGLGWQKFHPLQLLGFALLIFGMFMYNELLSPHIWHKIKNMCTSRRDETYEPIINNMQADEPIGPLLTVHP